MVLVLLVVAVALLDLERPHLEQHLQLLGEQEFMLGVLELLLQGVVQSFAEAEAEVAILELVLMEQLLQQ